MRYYKYTRPVDTGERNCTKIKSIEDVMGKKNFLENSYTLMRKDKKEAILSPNSGYISWQVCVPLKIYETLEKEGGVITGKKIEEAYKEYKKFNTSYG